MFNWNRFDRLFEDMFMNFKRDFDNSGWDKQNYTSPDGSFSITVMSKGFLPENKNLELTKLKDKLERAVEEQDFEEAVILRDKIKNLENNQEKINELQAKLDSCVKSQDFEKAIEYRDKIKNLKS